MVLFFAILYEGSTYPSLSTTDFIFHDLLFQILTFELTRGGLFLKLHEYPEDSSVLRGAFWAIHGP